MQRSIALQLATYVLHISALGYRRNLGKFVATEHRVVMFTGSLLDFTSHTPDAFSGERFGPLNQPLHPPSGCASITRKAPRSQQHPDLPVTHGLTCRNTVALRLICLATVLSTAGAGVSAKRGQQRTEGDRGRVSQSFPPVPQRAYTHSSHHGNAQQIERQLTKQFPESTD